VFALPLVVAAKSWADKLSIVGILANRQPISMERRGEKVS
jgi:hypothetical protein